MNLQLKLIAAGIIVALLAGSHLYAYRAGWSAHADKVNREYAERKAKADAAQQKSNDKAEKVRIVTETKYKVVTRDVVKYLQNPDRTKCEFDADSVRLRQQAIDAANAVSLNAK
ncbi:MAG: hypothetical protein [Caudoviricetes sp.]|nr:MAG: hypothetical protein [Caudoviricetes sp.]